MSDQQEKLPVARDVPPEDEAEEDEPYQTTVWDYLQSENGHQITGKVLTIISELKNSATASISAERSARLNAELDLRKFQHKVQLTVFGASILVVGGLSAFGKLDSGVSMLLGTMVGYFFGKSKNSAD